MKPPYRPIRPSLLALVVDLVQPRRFGKPPELVSDIALVQMRLDCSALAVFLEEQESVRLLYLPPVGLNVSQGLLKQRSGNQ